MEHQNKILAAAESVAYMIAGRTAAFDEISTKFRRNFDFRHEISIFRFFDFPFLLLGGWASPRQQENTQAGAKKRAEGKSRTHPAPQ